MNLNIKSLLHCEHGDEVGEVVRVDRWTLWEDKPVVSCGQDGWYWCWRVRLHWVVEDREGTGLAVEAVVVWKQT